jgi:hypothetical protein
MNTSEEGDRSTDGSGGGFGTGAAGGEGSPDVATIADAGNGVAADGGDGDDRRAEDAGNGDDATCDILDDSIVLPEGGSCRLSQQQQALYRLTGFGEVSCNQGRVSADGISAGQLTFNGLQIRCAATLAG